MVMLLLLIIMMMAVFICIEFVDPLFGYLSGLFE